VKLGDWASKGSQGHIAAGAYKECSHHQAPGFLGADTLSSPVDGSPLGHEERVIDLARQIVRGTRAFNLEMLVTELTTAVFQNLVL